MEEVLTEETLVGNEQVEEHHNEPLVHKRKAVNAIARGDHEEEPHALHVADEEQHEAEEPTQGAKAPCRKALERQVEEDALEPSDPQRREVHKTEARALARHHIHDKKRDGDGVLLLHIHETNERNDHRQRVTKAVAHIIQIEKHQATKAREVEQNPKRHDLRHRHTPRTMLIPLLGFLGGLPHHNSSISGNRIC